jgi:hypothetical protein
MKKIIDKIIDVLASTIHFGWIDPRPTLISSALLTAAVE